MSSATITLFGIPNCDTVRKAKKQLESQGVDFAFHDFKKQGLSIEQIQAWLEQQPIEFLVNKRSTSWKQLSDAQKEDLMSSADLSILTSMPTLIKRPVLQTEDQLLVGFKVDDYAKL